MADERTLTENIEIPQIQGEMVILRAATADEGEKLDSLGAFSRSVDTYGKTADAQRSIVASLVQRSRRWQNGERTRDEGKFDAEARGVLAWSMFAKNMDPSKDSAVDGDKNDKDDKVHDQLIGMVFLVDIDAWNSSARIQVVLGENYRGRGYTRDVMPRVMTYAFAPKPAGLGLHRIWMSVPSSNSRTLAVYQSLGFTETGVSRDALWNPFEERYKDQHVFDILVDEFDPIQSLETFGLHAIMENPGVKEALAQYEHTMEVRQRVREEIEVPLTDLSADVRGSQASQTSGNYDPYADDESRNETLIDEEDQLAGVDMPDVETIAETMAQEADLPEEHIGRKGADAGAEKKSAHQPWWRTLGAGRRRQQASNKSSGPDSH
ncbi:GNAT family N-acetyltransferase [Alloscardovia venturai]|uniref:GNAT family N-acetyltransferase n=1 Tax=Alloscardovia venturai TaxID=1769421 RepID=A0ABW2Y305_9BIFI